jgi:O-acetyl-ADP-ribose deacetylase (regulator of RNase III)
MIKHIKCDIFESGADVICHQVNCQGVMGSGIAKQVREKYPYVYKEYKEFCDKARKEGRSPLGCWQAIQIDEDNPRKYIINIFAQENFGYDGKCYTDYKVLRTVFEEIRAATHDFTIAIPYLMGCHRGGGDWNVVYKMIEEVFGNSDCEVLICEYNGG